MYQFRHLIRPDERHRSPDSINLTVPAASTPARTDAPTEASRQRDQDGEAATPAYAIMARLVDQLAWFWLAVAVIAILGWAGSAAVRLLL